MHRMERLLGVCWTEHWHACSQRGCWMQRHWPRVCLVQRAHGWASGWFPTLYVGTTIPAYSMYSLGWASALPKAPPIPVCLSYVCDGSACKSAPWSARALSGLSQRCETRLTRREAAARPRAPHDTRQLRCADCGNLESPHYHNK